MKDELQPIFYTNESRYGCSQPVRKGDILRIRSSRKPFLVTGNRTSYPLVFMDEDPDFDPPPFIEGLVDGSIKQICIDDLEVLLDE
jgi:hypothetical protein